MARQEGSYKLTSNIEARFSAPMDARDRVPTKTDLYTIVYGWRGMLVYVEDEDSYYKLVNDLPAFPASWVFYGQSGMNEVTEKSIDEMFE